MRFDRSRIEPAMRRHGPWISALVSIAIVWLTWGSLRPQPVYHDEDAYILQAEIFARGGWTAPAPPLPGFFDQPHVLESPRVAAKYPPGHALLLAAGALLGWPALIPLLLTGITAALLFSLVARMTNAWAAVTAWAFWVTTPLVARFQPSYFSQVTTGALVLMAWWAFLKWRDTHRRRWMLVLAFAIAWGGITRPVSMLAFAIPLGVVVLRDVVTQRAWGHLGAGAAVGVAIALLVPAWSHATSGSWSVTPIEAYRRDYLPFDRVGFAADTTPPRLALSPVMRSVYDEFLAHRKRQTMDQAPRTAARRLVFLSNEVFPGARGWLIPLALIGAFAAGPTFAAAAIGVLLLFLAHLPYGHERSWTIYYLEAVPIIAILVAVGAWRVATWVLAQTSSDRTSSRSALVMCGASVLLLASAPGTLGYWRQRHEQASGYRARFERALAAIPEPSIVFVRDATRPYYVNVVRHHVDPDGARAWVVHDLGDRNAELLRLAPTRAVYVFDERANTLQRQR